MLGDYSVTFTEEVLNHDAPTQLALPLGEFESEFNDYAEFFAACYMHTEDPLQSFIRNEINNMEQAS